MSLSNSTSPRESLVALREFPWQTGLVLQSGSLEEAVTQWLDQHPSNYPHLNTSVILAQARVIDQFNLASYFEGDPRLMRFVANFMSSTHENFLNSGHFNADSPRDIGAAAHVLLRLQMFDQMAGAIGFPANSERITAKRLHLQRTLPPKLLNLMDSLSNWTTPIQNIKRNLRQMSTPSTPGLVPLAQLPISQQLRHAGIVMTPNACPDSLVLQHQLVALTRVLKYTNIANVNNVLANIELLAFGAVWFSQEGWGRVEDIHGLELVMKTHGLSAMTPNFFSLFGPDNGRSFFSSLKLCCQVASAVSPIAVFIPKKWASQSIRRDHLVSVSHMLGNEKPSTLQQVEKAIWRMVIRIVSGSTAERELKTFLDEFDSMLRIWELKDELSTDYEFFSDAAVSAPVSAPPHPSIGPGPAASDTNTNPSSSSRLPSAASAPFSALSQFAMRPVPLASDVNAPTSTDRLPSPPQPSSPFPSDAHPSSSDPIPSLPLPSSPSSSHAPLSSSALLQSPLDTPALSPPRPSSPVHPASPTRLPSPGHLVPPSPAPPSTTPPAPSPLRPSSPVHPASPTRLPSPGHPVPPSPAPPSSPARTPSTTQPARSPPRLSSPVHSASLAQLPSPSHPLPPSPAPPSSPAKTPSTTERARSKARSSSESSLSTMNTDSDLAAEQDPSADDEEQQTPLSPRKSRKDPNYVEVSSDDEMPDLERDLQSTSLHKGGALGQADRQRVESRVLAGSGAPVKRAFYGQLVANISPKPLFELSDPAEMAEEPCVINIFGLESGTPSFSFEFRTHKNVAKLEYDVLRNVQRLVEDNYVKGVPRHHLPSARSPELELGASVFFIVNHADFLRMSAQQIQRVARDRHIVVRNVPQPHFDWNHDTLAELGSVSQMRDIQVGQYRMNDDVPNMLQLGSLDALLSDCDRRILACLSLPTSAVDIVPTPGIRALASDRWAWLQTQGWAGFRAGTHPIDQTNWATVATKGATSWWHVDDDGFATSTQLLTGAKYWVMFNQDKTRTMDGIKGNLGGTQFAPPFEQALQHEFEGYFTAEAVVIQPGDLLFQRPNSPHYVVTLDHSAAVGHHYYATSSMRDSVYGIIHSLVRRSTVTNDTHYTTRVLLRRMLTAWIHWYMSGEWEQHPLPAHIVDVTQLEGLLDIIAVGNVIELAWGLDQREHTGFKIEEDENEEISATMTRYHRFMQWYSTRFALLINKEWVSPSYLFKKRLIDFAATVVLYVKQQEKDALEIDTDHTLTSNKLKSLFTKHIQTHWAVLVDYWTTAQQNASPCLYHTQPAVQLLHLTDEKLRILQGMGLVEKNDFSTQPIHTPLPPRLPPASSSTHHPLPAVASHVRKRGPPSPQKPPQSSSKRAR